MLIATINNKESYKLGTNSIFINYKSFIMIILSSLIVLRVWLLTVIIYLDITIISYNNSLYRVIYYIVLELIRKYNFK